MNSILRTSATSFAIVGTATLVTALFAAACSSSDPAGSNEGFVEIANFEILPLERTCPANAPVTPGGPGLPATYAIVIRFLLLNQTSREVTLEKIASNGSVVGAQDDVGLGRPAHVFANLQFSPTTPVAAGGELLVSAPVSVLCGDSPTIYKAGYWDIATTLNVTSSEGPVAAPSVVFRRIWEPCGLAGHPCPVTQPPLPAN